jgi:hypothetical protein
LQDIFVFWSGASSSTRGGVGLSVTVLSRAVICCWNSPGLLWAVSFTPPSPLSPENESRLSGPQSLNAVERTLPGIKPWYRCHPDRTLVSTLNSPGNLEFLQMNGPTWRSWRQQFTLSVFVPEAEYPPGYSCFCVYCSTPAVHAYLRRSVCKARTPITSKITAVTDVDWTLWRQTPWCRIFLVQLIVAPLAKRCPFYK